MKEQSTGRLIPAEPDKAAILLDAFGSLRSSSAFKAILARIEERLSDIDRSNRKRGSENQFTEAQAWEWFLAVTAEAEGKSEVKTIELQV
jgi:hypothetical protein